MELCAQATGAPLKTSAKTVAANRSGRSLDGVGAETIAGIGTDPIGTRPRGASGGEIGDCQIGQDIEVAGDDFGAAIPCEPGGVVAACRRQAGAQRGIPYQAGQTAADATNVSVRK